MILAIADNFDLTDADETVLVSGAQLDALRAELAAERRRRHPGPSAGYQLRVVAARTRLDRGAQ